VQQDRKDLREFREVRVAREDRELVAHRDGADQEVCVRRVDAFGAAAIEERAFFGRLT
jgi:hypothetical protein